MGKRLERIMEVRNINEAHNGYLEVFLTTGSIGVFLFGLWILSIYKNCREAMIKTLVLGRLRMTFFFTVLAYNITESGFKGLSLVLFLFVLVGMSVPHNDGGLDVMGKKFKVSPSMEGNRSA